MRRIAADKAVGTRVRFKGGMYIWKIVKIDTTTNSKPVLVRIVGQLHDKWVAWRELELAEE